MGILLEVVFTAIGEAIGALIVDPWMKRLPRWGKIGCSAIVVAGLVALFVYAGSN